ncbi:MULTISPECIES: ATPase, T2SS/T4P/T4SS family [Vibrio]|uniref:ATPase, T2SS/T4P/T4SS family n=1 Tax=Vibrio TaxID=662 RepID=UPI001E5A4657|nr:MULTISPECIES: ATPase, T2SS/T4P/T4SS family [Vibrio]MCC2524948.1 Flp pilus assembly complex ATPase component TadA [Vibrio coralliilyticus]USD35493.1 Flp pilus assembly complex ATPase component TadA [Vibrio sp. SCSIO 43186]USD72617.1 Flp pilus assembly complex ATPase component TadA [Vibrio sp. SCSIO 43139]USD99008.1 hypothetical protein CTT30_23330 [Vibrio coralliilyticus]
MKREFGQNCLPKVIVSIKDLGEISSVHGAEELSLGADMQRKIVFVVSAEFTKYPIGYPQVQTQDNGSNEDQRTTHAATEKKVGFLLIAEHIEDALERNEYREIIKNAQQAIKIKAELADHHVVVLKVTEDLILNALEMKVEKSDSEERNDTEKAIDAMLLNAYETNTSDIHIICGDHENSIFFRRDGELELYGKERNKNTLHTFASVLYASVAGLSGNIAGIGFNEHDKLDGSLFREINGKTLGARIASHSTTKKDKNFSMVLRCTGDQNATAERIPFELLGFRFNQAEVIKTAMFGKGITLLIGETNSGKSVTQENMLMYIGDSHHGTKKIISIENPIERNIKGVVQHTLIKSGVTDPSEATIAIQELLSYVVRSDSDDIAIGEINNSQTCEAAIQSSLSGHNVLATLHCDSPFDIFERLQGFGANSVLLKTGEVLKSAVAQKLFKKLCPHCSLRADDIRDFNPLQLTVIEQLAEMGLAHRISDIRFRSTSGCSECRHRGISGRQLVAEVVEFNSRILELVSSGEKDKAKIEWLKGEHFSRQEIALTYVFEGVIDPTDVIEQFDSLKDTFKFRTINGIEKPKVVYQ